MKVEIHTINWIEAPDFQSYKMFEDPDEPVRIHIIKTGFTNLYLVVWEDAYEILLGEVEILTKEQIKTRFNIDV